MIGLVSLLVLVAVVVSKNPGKNAMCSHEGYRLIEGIFGQETHWLCVRLVAIGETPLASENSAILLDPDAVVSSHILQGYSLDDFSMAYGYPVDEPHSGSVEGYIGDDQHFYGVLHIGNRTLYADPYKKDNPKRKFGAFETGYDITEYARPMLRPRRNHIYAQYEDPNSVHFPFRIEEQKRIPGVARARVCDLLLLADREFFVHDANSSLSNAVRRMVHAVAQADIIFRNTDFNEDGVPDNIGFAVKYIVVLASDVTHARIFGDKLTNKVIEGREYLMKFARLRRLSEVCLGIAFSGHAFRNRTLGLSFTSLGGGVGGAAGGLCDRRAAGRSFNTIALAHATEDVNERVPERIASLTLAHEMGHSFGAHHDDNFPNPECRGFLMGSQSTSAETSRHFAFSICSKRLITATLSSMSYCLTDEDKPFCGNGIVEDGEACDCGLPSSCHRRDQCCTPRAGGAQVYEEGTLHVEGCTVAPSALCHPSQGLCCNSECMFENLSGSGIDCTTLSLKCNCMEMKDCKCALGGRCLPDGTCHAAECALLGLRECQCQKKGPGGKVSEARMCGICCEVPLGGEDRVLCVGAEGAARLLQQTGYTIPPEWPDEEYRGPNVTLKVCKLATCRDVYLRAWPAGDACVSGGVVGLCSLTGVCKPRFLTPRSNVYPKTMEIHAPVQTQTLTARSRAAATTKLNTFIFILTFVVRRLCK